MAKAPDKPLQVGDRVTVEGRHKNWLPFIVAIDREKDIATLQTRGTGGIYEVPLRKCKRAAHPKPKRDGWEPLSRLEREHPEERRK